MTLLSAFQKKSETTYEQHPENRKGFSLFEVMIATGILGCSLMALLGLVNQSHNMNKRAVALLEQSILAQSKMNEILMLEDLGPSSSGSGTFENSNFCSYAYAVTKVEPPFQGEFAANETGLVKVTLTISDKRTGDLDYEVIEYAFGKKK